MKIIFHTSYKLIDLSSNLSRKTFNHIPSGTIAVLATILALKGYFSIRLLSKLALFGKMMIFGQIYWKILRAYANIWSKNFLIKMQKNGNFNNQMEFRKKSI